MNSQNKLVLASLIKERKDILFGKFTNTLTHDVKNREWKQILSILNDQGIFNGRDYKYIRDVAWQNIKRATLKKVANSKRTGTVRRYKCIFNDLDKIITNIVGKDTPTVQGNIDEPSPILSENVVVLPLTVNIEEDEEEEIQEESKFDNHQLPPSSGKMRYKAKNPTKNLEEDILFLKRKKLQLEVYNLQLDAIKKELELGLPSSNLTAEVEKDSQSDLTSTPSESIGNLNEF